MFKAVKTPSLVNTQTSSFRQLNNIGHVKRITDNEKLLKSHIETMAPINVKMRGPQANMN